MLTSGRARGELGPAVDLEPRLDHVERAHEGRRYHTCAQAPKSSNHASRTNHRTEIGLELWGRENYQRRRPRRRGRGRCGRRWRGGARRTRPAAAAPRPPWPARSLRPPASPPICGCGAGAGCRSGDSPSLQRCAGCTSTRAAGGARSHRLAGGRRRGEWGAEAPRARVRDPRRREGRAFGPQRDVGEFVGCSPTSSAARSLALFVSFLEREEDGRLGLRFSSDIQGDGEGALTCGASSVPPGLRVMYRRGCLSHGAPEIRPRPEPRHCRVGPPHVITARPRRHGRPCGSGSCAFSVGRVHGDVRSPLTGGVARRWPPAAASRD
jgi:hypothetical protein